MATAYATFANGGHRIQPYFIEQIYNYNNTLLFQANPQQACALCFNEQLDDVNKKLIKEGEAKTQEQSKSKAGNSNMALDSESGDKLAKDDKALDMDIYDASPDSDRLKAPVIQYVRAEQAPRILKPRVAFEMADILRDVIQRGTAVKAKALGRDDIGGKTGTTNDAKDAWFAGFHPTNATVVWMGFDQPSTLGRREYGGVAALPVWMDFMKAQLKDTPHQWVSINNRAKSKKQKQTLIELMDEGSAELEDEDGEKLKPVKTATQQRKAPTTETAEEKTTNRQASEKPKTNRDSSTQPKTLTVMPAESMPPLPE